ncbi:hypothetical protein P167DRAFT_545402 [Morchella conica CCBAS932]|uniref:GRAM domain-containing protein n=1 Tax=Morchella conica CCBAS932 TaxID=1392247 RepID=A0A3N4KSU4_9PEZI|nr:hypothetical protein P167DRAFT_545402 [Morchella conica CCBAS932]
MVDTGRDWNHRSPSLRSEFVIPTTSTRSLTIPAEETSVANGLEGRHWQRHSSSDTTRSATARSISTNHSNLNLDLPASRASGGKREKLKTLKENAVNALRHNGNSAGKGKGKGKDNSRSQSHSPAAGGVGSSEGDENVDGRAEDEDKASSKSNNAASPRRQSLSSKLAHPRTALKASLAHIVAGKLSTLNDPYIPQEAEVEFVEAHEERNEALKDGCMEDVEDAEKRIEGLHRQRRNMQVNWTIHRHVTNVTVAPTKQRIIEKPRKSDFIIRDESGNPIIEFENGGERIDYVKWLGQISVHYLLYATQDYTAQYIDYREPRSLSLEKARSSIERLFVSTAPWQEWLLHVFRVYRWENPYETFRWLCLYMVLWHYSYLITFLWFCVIYYTLRRYIYPETEIEDLRVALERVRNTDRKAYDLGDVIVHKGPQEWLLPLADTIGPWAQIQLGDLADLLEILENFYEWRNPVLTSLSLSLFTSVFLFGLIASPEFCLKATYFGLGVAFFAWFPISSRYPKYRLVVSPVRWLFWNIPTHAEWAFQELSAEAEKNREKITAKDVEKALVKNQQAEPPDCVDSINSGTVMLPAAAAADGTGSLTSTLAEEQRDTAVLAVAEQKLARPLDAYVREYATFNCRCGLNLGKLVIHPSGLRFESLRKRRTIWDRAWIELVEIKKVKSSEPVGRLLSLEGLEMVFTDSSRVRLGDMVDRGEAFKWILGYSRLKWRSNN